ncbi:MAG: hypothetical protein M3511_02490 [Deinococcota bacterium]|nr:hypothetical protein [Deinococcota bacterium]
MLTLTAVLAAVLALVHFFAGRLRFLQGIPRSQWLSMAGGTSVAYVFVHLLPDLSEAQRAFESAEGPLLGYLKHHVYLIALLGLVVFYGLERVAKGSRARRRRAGEGDSTGSKAFWLHIAFFAFYNALIGYLIFSWEPADVEGLLFFVFAIALHFVVNDYGLRNHHEADYDHLGRWVLAGAILAGWGLGNPFELHETTLAVPFAFLGGAIILNVLKEELPEERESRYWAFALGVALYTVLLLTL